MQRRRERIERWRQERKKTTDMATVKAEALEQAETLAKASGKKWSLEDDDDGDDDADDEAEEEVSVGGGGGCGRMESRDGQIKPLVIPQIHLT